MAETKLSDPVFRKGQSLDLPRLFASSAGGVFATFADMILREGGCVGGAVWTKDFGVRMELVDDKAGLRRLLGVKCLLGSEIGFIDNVRKALATGRRVLIGAMPCQVERLRHMFGELPNLVLVDMVCNGMPSDEAFREWRASIESRCRAPVVGVRFDTKEFRWGFRRAKVTLANGKSIYVCPNHDAFLRDFLAGSRSRPECAACQLRNGVASSADVTLGVEPGMFRQPWSRLHLGVSTVEAWTQAGKSLLAACAPLLHFTGETSALLDFSRGRGCRQRGFWRAARALWRFVRKASFSPTRIWQEARANGFLRIARRHPQVRLLNGMSRAIVKGRMNLGGDVLMGVSGTSICRRCETLLYVDRRGLLKVRGNFALGQGSQMIVSGTMDIGAESGFNEDAYVWCENRIVLGRDVRAGRGVTIRDTNGHWMNFPAFRISKPIVIGDHVWLCDECKIMPGASVGSGSVVGSRAVVQGVVPPNSLVIGNPAKIVCSNVEWQY